MATASMRGYDAPAPASDVVPAYRVFAYEGPPVEKIVCRFDEKTRTNIKETVFLEGGYMVVFAKGHSNWYPDLQALENAGLGEVVPLIRMKEGAEAEVNKDVAIPSTRRTIEGTRSKE